MMRGGGATTLLARSGDAGDGGGAAGVRSTSAYAMRCDGADMHVAIVGGGVRGGGGVGVLTAASKSGFMGHTSYGGHGV
jgi:hypothetical protein